MKPFTKMQKKNVFYTIINNIYIYTYIQLYTYIHLYIHIYIYYNYIISKCVNIHHPPKKKILLIFVCKSHQKTPLKTPFWCLFVFTWHLAATLVPSTSKKRPVLLSTDVRKLENNQKKIVLVHIQLVIVLIYLKYLKCTRLSEVAIHQKPMHFDLLLCSFFF